MKIGPGVLALIAAFALCFVVSQTFQAQDKSAPSLTGIIEGPDDLTPELIASFKVHCYKQLRLNDKGYYPAECRYEIDEYGHFKLFDVPQNSKLILEIDGWSGVTHFDKSKRQRVPVKLLPASRVNVSLGFKDLEARPIDCHLTCRLGSFYEEFYFIPHAEGGAQKLSDKGWEWPFQFPEGKHSISVYWGEKVPASPPGSMEFEVSEGGATSLVFPCIGACDLQLIETEGRTVVLKGISLTTGEQTLKLNFFSGGTGVLNCSNLPAGEYTLRIAPPGYEPISMPVMLSPAETTVVRYTLIPTPDNLWTGRVVDAIDGKGISGAVVTLRYDDPGVLTNDAGEFTCMEPSRHGPNRPVSVAAEGYEFGVAEAQPDGSYLARLERSTRLHGTMKGAKGMSFTFTVRPCDEAGEVNYRSFAQEGTVQSDETFSVTLRRVIPDQRPRTWPAKVAILVDLGGARQVYYVEGIGPDTWHEQNIELAAGGSISGTVTGSDGKPVPGLEMNLTHPKVYEPYRTTTDAQGKYQFSGLGDGSFTIEMALSETAWVGSRKTISIKSGASVTQDYDFTGTCTLVVRAMIGSSSVTSATIYTEQGRSQLAMAMYGYSSTVPGALVTLTIHGLQPRSYYLTLNGYLKEHPGIEVTVPKGETRMVVEGDFGPKRVWGKISLPPDIDMSTVGNWKVVMLDAPSRDKPETPISADGSFEFADLPAGSYRAVAEVSGFISEPIAFDLTNELELKFVLKPAAALVLKPTLWESPVDSERLNVVLKGEKGPDGKSQRLFFQDLVLKKGETTLVSDAIIPGKYEVELVYPAGKFKAPTDYWTIESFKWTAKGGEAHEAKFEVRACAALEITDVAGVLRSSSVKITNADGKEVGRLGQQMGRGRNQKLLFTELPEGKLTVVASKNGYQNHEETVETKIGEAAKLSIELKKN